MNEIKETVNEQLQQLQMLMHRSSFSGFHGEHNPHRGQGRVLALLKLKPETSQKELTYLLGLSKQAVAELIAKLERSGYITREPSEEDKRMMIIKLTEEGRKAADDVHSSSAETSQILDCLSDDELATFSDYLGRIINQYEEQFPEVDFEQQRQAMENFMSFYGRDFRKHGQHPKHGFGRKGHPSNGMKHEPFMKGDFKDEYNNDEEI